MDEYLNITIHHSGQFVTEDMSVYEGAKIADLRGALEIADLYKVHLSVKVFIQHTLSKPDYADETEVVLDKVPLNVIVDETVVALEEMLNETDVREDGVRVCDVSMDGVGEDDIREDGVHAVGTDDNVPMVDVVDEVESDDIGHRAGEVDDVVRLTDDDDSSDDSTFNYDSATKLTKVLTLTLMLLLTYSSTSNLLSSSLDSILPKLSCAHLHVPCAYVLCQHVAAKPCP
ncbi:unnamed protein product [Vicia faba]|uniref:Uncharacterized protein n=1 Tax=Vicia faba TaxID=3906 RepID=A0AAV0ZV18_VICFA|nr:unnamed protein product [Vicia faba]